MPARPTQVCLLNDGKAGHFNQARAVVMALERFLRVETTVLQCRFRLAAWQHPVRLMLNATNGRLPLSRMAWFYAGDLSPDSRADLIVSAGGNTCAANAWLGSRLPARNLFCGQTRGVRTGLFDGVISAYPKDAHKAGFIINPTPVPVDRGQLTVTGESFRRSAGLSGIRLWTMLIGGQGAGYTYSETDWRELGRAMNRAAQRHNIRWLLSTSRRTGPGAEQLIQGGLAKENVAGFQYVSRGAGSGVSYAESLGAAETIFCTEDSHMMISEAIATGKSVVTLQPEKFRTDPTNLHFLDLYQAGGFIVRLPLRDFDTATTFKAANAGTEPPPSVDSLATKLQSWWNELPAKRPNAYSS